MAKSKLQEKFKLFDDLFPLLKSMYEEFEVASKKKPEATVSNQKVVVVNRLLTDVFGILEDEPTRAYLDLLDTEMLPQNSDVVLMLGQAKAAMTSFRSKFNYYTSADGHGWKTTPKKGD